MRALDPVLGTVLFACFCAALGMAAAHAATVDIAGVKVPDTATVANSHLLLNGAGVRHKGPFKVYTAALYLDKKGSTRETVHTAPGAKRIVLTMLREIKAEELGNLFMRSMEQNTPKADLLKVLPALPRMGDIFVEQKKLMPGESITIDWIPGTGTVLSAKGKVLGQPFKEPEFFHAMLDIWLGKDPADCTMAGSRWLHDGWVTRWLGQVLQSSKSPTNIQPWQGLCESNSPAGCTTSPRVATGVKPST